MSVLVQSGLPADLYAATVEDKQKSAEEKALGMVDPSDPVLRHVAREVGHNKVSSARIQHIIIRLFATAEGQRRGHQASKKRRTLVGLAAPQIGEGVRIIVMDPRIGPDRKHPGKLVCLIDPEIVWRSRETEEGREGCFSAGPVWGLVRRSVAVKVRAFTPGGKRVEHIFEGFTARIAQHEIDHLDGVRFADRITSDRKRHWVHTEELADYPKHIKHWPRLCTRTRWEAFKHGNS